MIDTVQVGANKVVEAIMNKKSPEELREVSTNVNRSIHYFLEESKWTKPDEIVILCQKIAGYFDETVVASHFITSDGVLHIFLDAMPPTIKEKFLYTLHNSRMH